MSAQAATARALAHSKRPALVFASPRATDGAGVLDLRALDTPVSDLALRNAVRVAWRASATLTVRVDGAPDAQVLTLLHGLVRRELRFSADHIERFDDQHELRALTDAEVPSAALLALFPLRVRAQSVSVSAVSGRSHAR